jgi:hypothetical protein
MKEILNYKKWFAYYLPLSLILFLNITIKKSVVDTDGGYEAIFGAPFSFITNNLGCTGCFEVYCIPLFLDFLIYLSIVISILLVIQRFIVKLRTPWLITGIGILICAFCLFQFYVITFESRFELINNINYRTVSWQFHFGSFPF